MLRLCREFKCLPSAVLAEDVELLRLLRIEELGTPPRDDGHGQYDDNDGYY